ncbi:MAG: hypothetical protein ACYCST_07200 [Acidimicrobiales bacterium]
MKNQQSNTLKTEEKVVVFGGLIVIVLGVTGFLAATISGLVHGAFAHERAAPIIGWVTTGLSMLVHLSNPAAAWPKGAGVGPAVVVWALWAAMVCLVLAGLWRIRAVREAVSSFRIKATGGDRRIAMSKAEAASHNSKLGVRDR